MRYPFDFLRTELGPAAERTLAGARSGSVESERVGSRAVVFSSLSFLFGFLPLTLALNFLVPRAWRNGVLLGASLLFYAWGELAYVALMVFSAGMNWAFGLCVDRARGGPRARLVLAIAVSANLGLLGWFKYANFFVDSIGRLFASEGGVPFELDPIHLPIGISFFTFQALSYVIDVHRDEGPVERNPLRVALYIALFPQLIAGPIVRFHDVAAELAVRHARLGDVALGVRRFVCGLAKKVLIANLMGAVADPIFALPADELTPSLAWLGATSYMLQIYFDFSGYSDMAIGLGRMLGFRFLENFRYPYIATSVTDFWRRWHISLSTWFRDYLYIPMGGNRHGAARTALHLAVVFLLCGLWHGASATFVLWGLYHGALLAIERGFRDRPLPRVLSGFGLAYAQLVVLVGWVLFRAETLDQTTAILSALAGVTSGEGEPLAVARYLSPMFLAAFGAGVVGATPILPALRGFCERRVAGSLSREAWDFASGLASTATMILLLAACSMQISNMSYNPFIYFRF